MRFKIYDYETHDHGTIYFCCWRDDFIGSPPVPLLPHETHVSQSASQSVSFCLSWNVVWLTNLCVFTPGCIILGCIRTCCLFGLACTNTFCFHCLNGLMCFLDWNYELLDYPDLWCLIKQVLLRGCEKKRDITSFAGTVGWSWSEVGSDSKKDLDPRSRSGR